MYVMKREATIFPKHSKQINLEINRGEKRQKKVDILLLEQGQDERRDHRELPDGCPVSGDLFYCIGTADKGVT